MPLFLSNLTSLSLSTTTTMASLILLFLLSLLIPPSIFSSSYSPTNESPQTYIIKVQYDAKPTIFPTHKHWYESSLTSGASLLHTYDTVFHGFSAKLTPSQAQHLKALPHVIAIIPEQVRHIHTTRSPHFLGLKTSDSDGLLKESDFGSDLVIGVIDTGIWPERQSFNDRDLGLVPAKWKGECVTTKDFPSSSCNRKIIGARFFCQGHESTNGKKKKEVREVKGGREE